jgi:hypothetical protein
MRKTTLFILTLIASLLGVVIGLFLLVQSWFYFTAPIYIFEPPKPFSGSLWYNPYATMDSHHWRKANFHFHTRAWSGVTAGRGNPSDSVWHTYKMLGYDIPGISNYQSISSFHKDSAYYIPLYEHGFGVRKKHQVLIGARKVLWRDYSFFQNLNHKQHIINLLREQNEIVAIAHPDWENGYSLRDMAYLSNYDLIEALDRNWRSIPQWDAALSAGRPVFLLGDDDAHNIREPFEIGVCATFINSPALNREDLIRALKTGNSYCTDMRGGEPFAEKARKARLVPRVESVKIERDTLKVRISGIAKKITFIGQGGRARKVVYLSDRAEYALQPEDTYIRTVFTFPNPQWGPGTDLYLNPVFRYNGTTPSNKLTASVNVERTWIFRVVTLGSLVTLVVVIIKLRKLRRVRNTG